MMMRGWLVVVMVVSAGFTCLRGWSAEEGVSERTVRQILVESAGLGSELRERIEEAGRLVSGNEQAQAMRDILALQDEFVKLMPDDGTVYVSVSTDEQFADFIGKHRNKKVSRLSWSFQKLWFLKAFVFAEEDPAKSLPVLDELLKYAPYSTDARCEKGYVCNLLGRYDEALKTYQEALDISKRFAGEKHNIPVALRGMGFSYFRLGRLNEAAKVYQESLQINPESTVARDGLLAIEQRRQQQSESAGGNGAPAADGEK